MFDSAKQKIDRAEHHIADLKAQFAVFVAEKPHRFSIQPDPVNGVIEVSVRFLKELPPYFSPIIADAIHNLRCALDHVMWELVGIDGGAQNRHLQFPTRDNRMNFEAACKGIETPSQWVKDAVTATEAFPGGTGNDLYQVTQLDNSDKHIEIIPVLRATSHPPVHITNPDGSARGTIESGTVVAASGSKIVKLFDVPPGCSVEFEHDTECPPSIFISQPGGLITSPAIATLRRYAASVRQTVATLEKAIPP